MENLPLIIDIAIVLFFAFANAAFTLFYSFCIGDPYTGEIAPGRIFSRLGLYLTKKYDAHEEREEKRIQEKFSGVDLDTSTAVNQKVYQKLNWTKAFGMCPPCTNIWFGIFSSVIIWPLLSISPLLILPYYVLSNVILRRWMTII